MKKTLLLIFALFLLLSGRIAAQQTLVHYWNFNDNASQTTLLTPNVSLVGGSSITHIQGPNSVIDLNGTGQNFNVNNYNARNGDVSGTHLRINSPIGAALEFALPTTGYKDVVVKFATRRSSTGAAGEQYWSYSIDGINFIPYDTIYPFAGDPTLETLDFDDITATDNNPNFKLRVEFGVGGPTTGNNRFDNFTLDGTPIVTPALVHYWNFNDNSSITNLLTSNVDLVGGNSITHIQGPNSAIDLNGTGQNFNINNYNARNGDASGTHLRLNSPIGAALEFALPTTGYKDAVVKFATRRSSTGAAGEQYWYYSVDGTNFFLYDTIFPFAGDPTLETLSFDHIPASDNNPNFKLRVEFGNGGPTTGNNRFDNFTLDADPLNSIDTIAPMVVFNPLNNAVNVPVNTSITLTFNENVRLVNNTPLDNNNAASVVELRLNNSSGALVPFTTTFNNNVITIIPSSNLLNSQQYYVALLPNTIEDFSDNAITTTQSIQFTTISPQTQFNAGDMVIVAYRMNATSTEDEVAILTLVDIIPGTMINITDAKYTSNAQPQCSGGLVWTAPSNACVPAGTVIYIQTNAVVTNIGTLTGSGFGLSSSGDQVILYTGTASNPNYITALTSIDWVSNNTNCGGSLSMIPAGLVDGVSSLNTSTAPGNTSGNAVNAYYNGTQTGTTAALRSAILDPANWIAVAGATPPQQWPNYNFPSSPTVTHASVLNGTTIQLIFNSDLDPTSAQDINNYNGIAGLVSAMISNNGSLIDTVFLTYSSPFTPSTSYTLTVNNILSANNILMACAYTYSFTYNTSIAFNSNFIVVDENHGTLNLQLNLTNPSNSSVELVVLGAPFSTADTNDFTLTSQVLNFTSSSNASQIISIPIIDDTNAEQHAEYFVLALRNPLGCAITGDTIATIYIKDNDRTAPVPNQEIELVHIASFDPSGANNSTCEVVAYDASSQRLVTTSALTGILDIIDFSNPASPTTIQSINMNVYGGLTSVAVKSGIIAAASPNANEQLDGTVVFFDINGNFLNQVTVGALPDMITFTPDGNKVLTANEGQPNNSYSVDPEGSVSIIDVSNGIANLTQANVTTLYFTAYNAQEAALIASGIRKTKSTSTLSQDLEPEYITINAQSTKAWVSLQENNAIAEIDLTNNTILDLWALGTKDVSVMGNGYDVSDNNNEILIANWPIKSYYQPDAMGHFTVNGVNYLLTANEGDEKEYSGLNERTTVGSASYVLDPVAFPNAAMLKRSYNLGRMRVSNLNGDLDNDGDFDEIYSVGSRSFSIFNADTKQLVYDSGDNFEMYTALTPSISSLFNSNHEDNSFKNRSRAKGPEPEGIAIAKICNRTYGFISLERIGGVMVYNISDPSNVQFVDYKNTRNFTTYGGDNGPETMTYIPAAQSPDGEPYIIVANEISGTLTIFKVQDNVPAQQVNTTASICQGQTLAFGSLNLTTAGNYTQTFTNIYGCDSIVNLSLTVNPLASGIHTVTACSTYTWINGVTYTSNNTTATHTLAGAAANGCDSVVTLNLTVININNIVNQNGITLTAAQNGATYQWIDCDNANAPIPGATQQSFTPSVNGRYAVEITLNGCTRTSFCLTVNSVGLEETQNQYSLSIYPNPNNGKFTVECSKLVDIEIFDAIGRSILKKQVTTNREQIDLGNVQNGIYFIKTKVESDEQIKRIVINK
ncbi:MAG: choice-of-anchor I family protein [Bacteroidia bacterium]